VIDRNAMRNIRGTNFHDMNAILSLTYTIFGENPNSAMHSISFLRKSESRFHVR